LQVADKLLLGPPQLCSLLHGCHFLQEALDSATCDPDQGSALCLP
jgi:hypothetical protein